VINDVVSTAGFSTQAGIDAAVSVLTSNFGTAASGMAGTKVVVVLNNGASDDNAVFLFTESGNATTTASELQLIGVVRGSIDIDGDDFI
jgi:hypothetical protein